MSKCSVCTYEGPEVSANAFERGSIWNSKIGVWTGPLVTAYYAPTCIWCDERADAADDHQLVGDWGR